MYLNELRCTKDKIRSREGQTLILTLEGGELSEREDEGVKEGEGEVEGGEGEGGRERCQCPSTCIIGRDRERS